MGTKVIFRVPKSQYLLLMAISLYFAQTQIVGLEGFGFPRSWLLSLLSYHPNNGKDSLSFLFHPLPLDPNAILVLIWFGVITKIKTTYR